MAVTGVEAVATGVNLLWVLVVTFLIFFMHAGFAMLEAGQVRAKNVANQLTKNLLTWSVGVLAFFLVGAAVSTVAGAVTGGSTANVGSAFAGTLSPGSENAWVDWLFGAVFAMTAATIVSGAVAGRAKLRAYVGYTVVLAAVIYPVVSGISWGDSGLLVSLGFHDFAGGMVVHGMGGVAGLVAAWVIGPRVDRFGPDGEVNVIPGHSITFAVLGTLILAFGWYGFNVGTAATVLEVADDGTVSLAAFATVGRVALTTTLAMAAGAVGAGAVSAYKTGKVDTLYVANGLLAGLVGITGITDATVWPGAIAVGLLAGAQLPVVFELVEKKLGIDDVCAVFPVHGSAGILGALAFPFVATGTWGAGFDAAFLADALVAQTVGVVVIVGWTAAATAVVFGVARALGQARVSESHERDGLDVSEHGVETYPEFGRERGTGVRTDGSGRRRGERPATDGSGRRRDNGPAGNESDDLRTDGGTAPNDDLVTDGGDPEPVEGDIELVMAIVRPDRLGDVKTALAEVGAPSLTVTNVSGRGSQPAKKGQWRGEEYTVDLHQKVKIECVVADIDAADVAAAILDAAHTGEKGDGKVFVLPVSEAYQVRTGKTGPDAV